MEPEEVEGPDPVDELFVAVFDLPRVEREARLARAPAAVADAVRQLLRFGPGTLAAIQSGLITTGDLRRSNPQMIGRQLGPYRLDALIGVGGFGAVYRATSERFEQKVAVKVLTVSTPDLVARFRREGAVLATLGEHRHIVRLHGGHVDPDGTSYIAMEHVDGPPIGQHCAKAKLDLPARVALFREVCSAVQYAHSRGVFHRDLKPDNIRVADDRAKLLDFGIAKILDGADLPDDPIVTREDDALFTPVYASPEQLRRELVTAASEVYSLGVVLFELVTGRLPYELGDRPRMADVERAVCETEPLVADRAAPTMPSDLARILAMALAKEPERRYQSVQEFSDDLGRLLANEPVRATAPTLGYLARKFVVRHPVSLGTVALVSTLLTMLLLSQLEAWAWEREAKEALEILNVMPDPTHAKRLLDEEPRLEISIRGEVEWQRWQTEFDELVGRRSDYVEFLNKVRARADTSLPERPEDARQRADQRYRLDYLIARRSDYRRQLERALAAEAAGGGGSADPDAVRDQLRDAEALVAAAAKKLDEPLSFRFRSSLMQLAHDEVSSLVRAIDEFGELRPGRITALRGRIVQRRIDAMKQALKDPENLAAWHAAANRVRADPRFGELELAPQEGLIPLGRDPDSRLEEFALLISGTTPGRDPHTGVLRRDAKTAVIMVLLPGGRGRFGVSRFKESLFQSGIHFPAPEHSQDIDPFFLAKHEINQAQWESLFFIIQATVRAGQKAPGGRAITKLHPVESIEWTAAREMMRRYALVLPTEAQWEYACRAGTVTPWSTGDSCASLQGFANVADASLSLLAAGEAPATAEIDDGFVVHAPVGSFAANAFGLHDMHGNVAEWCDGEPRDFAPPDAKFQVVTGLRVARGGSWRLPASAAKSWQRAGRAPGHQFRDVGVRPARPIR